MTDTAATETTETAPSNGATGAASPIETPTTPDGHVMAGMPKGLIEMLSALDKLPPEKQLALQRKIQSATMEVLKEGTAEASSLQPLAAGELKPISTDPGDFPSTMLEIPDIAPLWTLEAIEAASYMHGGKKVYQALDALSIESLRLPNGEELFQFELASMLLCSDSRGTLVKVERGRLIMTYGCYAMRNKLADVFKKQKENPGGFAHVRIRPTGFITRLSGVRELAADVRFEKDGAGNVKLFSRQATQQPTSK
jgi:hypothetical protein